MNHCIIMTAYKDSGLINRFISKVPEEWGIYIHIDKKSSIKCSDINQRANVCKWYRIYWGASEHLFAIWRLIQTAAKEGNWDYYHIVSGSDYFASRPNDFDDILGDEGNNYIQCNSVPYPGWPWSEGYDIFRLKFLCSYGDVRTPIFKRINNAFISLQRFFHIEHALPSYSLYRGLVYSSLHKDFIGWALTAELTNDLLRRLTNTVVAEEVFFQTLLMNSPFKNTVVDPSLHYYEWSGNIPPKTLTEDDYEKILQSKSLFCRKIDSIKSDKLLEMLP